MRLGEFGIPSWDYGLSRQTQETRTNPDDHEHPVFAAFDKVRGELLILLNFKRDELLLVN